MKDLSHWDFLDVLSAQEAASLILGLEPAEGKSNWAKLEPILQRMERDYDKAHAFYSKYEPIVPELTDAEFNLGTPRPANMLASQTMLQYETGFFRPRDGGGI